MLLGAACAGGQSGTESGGGKFDPMDIFTTVRTAPCGCALAASGTAVRATITGQDACGVRARVQEVLGAGPEAPEAQPEPGEELGGLPLAPCAEGLSLALGDEVLLVHVPAGDPALKDGALHGELLVVPWAATLQVSSAESEPVSLPREQLEVLIDPDLCLSTLYPDAGTDGLLPADGPFDPLDAGAVDAGADGGPGCGP